MKEKNIGVNAILNVIRQTLSIVFPLITYPYALRVLGPDGIGTVDYVKSIVSYFALFASLGMSNYIVREGSGKKNDSLAFTTFLNEVYSINVFLTVTAYIFLTICVLCVENFYQYRVLFAVQSISILFTTLGIEWINTIYEDFLRLTIRSICTYIVTLILLFLFVKDEDSYVMYAMLTVITNGIVCISNRIAYRNKIKLHITMKTNFRKHFKPLMIMFSSAMALTINTSFDITMLGWVHSTYYTGLYTLPVKIFSVVKSLFSAIYVVSIPRLSYLYCEHQMARYKEINTNVWRHLMLIIVPACTGMICISREIIYLAGGEELLQSTSSLQLLSAALLFAIPSGIIMNSMNITIRKEKENLIAVMLSAFVNIVFNYILIPGMYHNGAALATLISEIFLLVFSLLRFQNIDEYLDMAGVKKTLVFSAMGSLIVVMTSGVVHKLTDGVLQRLVLTTSVSVLLYGLFLIIAKEECTIRFIKKAYGKVLGRRS